MYEWKYWPLLELSENCKIFVNWVFSIDAWCKCKAQESHAISDPFLILCKSMEYRNHPLLSVPSTFLSVQLLAYFDSCFPLLSLQILQPVQWYTVFISPLEHTLRYFTQYLSVAFFIRKYLSTIQLWSMVFTH